jgi:hypothetical protein
MDTRISLLCSNILGPPFDDNLRQSIAVRDLAQLAQLPTITPRHRGRTPLPLMKVRGRHPRADLGILLTFMPTDVAVAS